MPQSTGMYVGEGNLALNGGETAALEPRFPRWKARVATATTGHTFNAVFDHLFNYWLYIPVIAMFGPIKGGVAMALADIAVSFAFIKLYDYAKTDWLGIEAAKEIQEIGPSWIKRLSTTGRIGRLLWWPFAKFFLLVLWAMRKGRIAAFFVVSILTDPFITTVYLRNGAFSGMTRKDYYVFFCSAIVGNAWWTLRVYAIILLAKLGMTSL